jgi:FixJ family two-component response regulator
MEASFLSVLVPARRHADNANIGELSERKNQELLVGDYAYSGPTCPTLGAIREIPDSGAARRFLDCADARCGLVCTAQSHLENFVTMHAQPTVHLVDDDDAVRDSLKTLLESYCLDVRDYSSALEFLTDAATSDAGCLVLDLHLPVVSGLDLLAMMRHRKISLPVVFITGRSDKETKERALRAGAVAFLDKPVEDDALIAAIDEALGRKLPRIPSEGGGEKVSAALQHQAS